MGDAMNCLMIHGSKYIRVFERLGKKYGCVLKETTNYLDNKKDYNATRSAKYTIKDKEMQAVLLPAFHFEQSKSSLKSKKQEVVHHL